MTKLFTKPVLVHTDKPTDCDPAMNFAVNFDQGGMPNYGGWAGFHPCAGDGYFEQLLDDVIAVLQQYQTIGVPDYISAEHNGGHPWVYPRGAMVRDRAGDVYWSLVDHNKDMPPSANWLALQGLQGGQGGQGSSEEAIAAAAQAIAAATAAQDSANAAANSATAAQVSAGQAVAAVGAVQGSANAAQVSANAAAISATAAQTSAGQSGAAATDAQASAGQSAASAAASQASADQSAAAVTAAQTSATNAASDATQAATSATAAQVSANSAANSATAAQGSADQSATSATAAQTSADQSAGSATVAQTSASNAANSVVASQTSAEQSAGSATAAQTSADQLAGSAAAAQISATNAAASATAAQTSETNTASFAAASQASADQAATSATAAQASEANVAASATAAQTSETNAANSATLATADATSAATSAAQALAALNSLPTRSEMDSLYAAIDHTHTFATITAKPDTLAGYGITDALPATGTAVAANKLASSHTLTANGDASWNVAFDGSADVAAPLTLANTGVAAGSYPKVTVDTKGRVTAGSALAAADIPALDWSKINSGKPTTLAGYGITDALPGNATATAADKLASSHTLTATGDATWNVAFDGSADVAAPLTLANTGVAAGSYGSATESARVTVDAKGRVTAAATMPLTPDWTNVTSKPTTLAGYGITDALPAAATATTANKLTNSHTLTATGDANWGVAFDGSADVTAPLTLANTGVAAGSYGSATTSAQVTVDAKGRVTAAATAPITPAWSSITSRPTTLSGYGITDALSATGTAVTASKLATARTIMATGDATWGVMFDGSATASGALNLATTGVAAGRYGSATAVPVISVDSKGRVTSASTVPVAVPVTVPTRGPVGEVFFWPGWVGSKPAGSYVLDGSLLFRAASPGLFDAVCPVIYVAMTAGSTEADVQGDTNSFNNQFSSAGFSVESTALPDGTMASGVNDQSPTITFSNPATATGTFAVRIFPWGYSEASTFLLPRLGGPSYVIGDIGNGGGWDIGKSYDTPLPGGYGGSAIVTTLCIWSD